MHLGCGYLWICLVELVFMAAQTFASLTFIVDWGVMGSSSLLALYPSQWK